MVPTCGWPEALSAETGARGYIRRFSAARASAIDQVDSGYFVELATGETLEAESIILATPAYVSGTLLASIDPG